MKFTDIITTERIVFRLESQTGPEVLAELAQRGFLGEGCDAGFEPGDHERIVEVLLRREELGSTAIKDGLAIPHGKLQGLSQLVACVGLHEAGVDFGAIDGQKSHVFIVLLSPEAPGGDHLKALARIARLFHDGTLARKLMQCEDVQAIYDEIAQQDARY